VPERAKLELETKSLVTITKNNNNDEKGNSAGRIEPEIKNKDAFNVFQKGIQDKLKQNLV